MILYVFRKIKNKNPECVLALPSQYLFVCAILIVNVNVLAYLCSFKPDNVTVSRIFLFYLVFIYSLVLDVLGPLFRRGSDVSFVALSNESI